MFDFSLGELALVIVVAVIFIGPKELPVVIKTVGKAMRALRSLSNEMKKTLNALSEEAGLKETAETLEREVQYIKGDDGKMYERYDMPVMHALPTDKSNES